MTSIAPDSKAISRCLDNIVLNQRRAIFVSAALVIADVIPAVGFAAGLGLSMGALLNAIPLDSLQSLQSTNWSVALLAALPGLILALTLCVRGALSYGATASAAHTSRLIKTSTRLRLAPGLFSGRLSDSEAMTAAVEGIDALDGYTARFLPVRRAAAVSPLLLIIFAAFVSPFTAGIFVFTLLPFVIGMILTGMAAGAESRRQFLAMERLSGLFVDRVRGLPAILAFQAESTETNRIQRAASELALRTSKVLKVAFLSSAILEFFSAVAVALVAVYCGFNLLRILPFPAPDALTLAQAFFLLALAPEVYHPMRRLAAAYHDRQAAESAAPHLQALENACPEPQQPADLVPETAPRIAYRNVSIAYRADHPVVHGFWLDAAPGSITALVGPSGSGKSSLLHLLLGLSPLSDGTLSINYQQVDGKTDFSSWIAYAGQSPMVIQGTLAENIALAMPSVTTGQILEAAAMAGINGSLDRVIDERGGGLSGGERRRLGLARAFLKPAPILLLDEPTAHLDSQSEQAILPIIRKAAEGRTTLIATHSDAVAALADTVVQL